MELLDSIAASIADLPLWAAWVAIVLATFVSEDLTCIAAGLIAARGDLPAAHAIGAAGAGIWLGDLLLYWAGAAIGRPALRRAPLSWFVHGEDVVASAQWFAHRGPAVILLGRFVPGSRLPCYFTAGVLQLGLGRFALLALAAVAVWAPLLGGVSMALGRAVLPWVEAYERWALPGLLATLLLLLFLFKAVVPSFTWRGRRLVVSRWRRLVRWEFWPPQVFYAPVLLYVLWLALRHRSLSVLTAVNPAMPAGGFVGESKWEILRRLDPALVVPAHRISAELSPEERVEVAKGFLRERGLGYPVVLKPDAGQRGSGVAVVRAERELAHYLARTRVDTLVQEYARGEEFGIFWYRLPGEPRGRILSITRKVLPVVTGDGERTLERLILEDERAVSLAHLYLDRNAARLWEVPAAGEGVRIAEIGNHCRGAIFLDACHLATPELERAMDAIGGGFEGFDFGRYDVVVPGDEDLRAGHGLRILELNGATSEATHIYDPRHGLVFAYRVLFEQWRILFTIASHNRARGAQLVPWTELLRRFGRYRTQARTHPS